MGGWGDWHLSFILFLMLDPNNAIIMCFKELLIGTEGAMYRVVGVGR